MRYLSTWINYCFNFCSSFHDHIRLTLTKNCVWRIQTQAFYEDGNFTFLIASLVLNYTSLFHTTFLSSLQIISQAFPPTPPSTHTSAVNKALFLCFSSFPVVCFFSFFFLLFSSSVFLTSYSTSHPNVSNSVSIVFLSFWQNYEIFKPIFKL